MGYVQIEGYPLATCIWDISFTRDPVYIQAVLRPPTFLSTRTKKIFWERG